MSPDGSTKPSSISLELPEWARLHESRFDHVERVADLVSVWADEMSVSDFERERWRRAVVLHDALKDAPDELLEEFAGEWTIPAVRHGPAAARWAERDGDTDVGVLDAVRYHSVGYAGWETVGKVLFLADYLESGRDYHTAAHGQLSDRVPSELEQVLRTVSVERLCGVLRYGYPLLKETVEFWNSLHNVR